MSTTTEVKCFLCNKSLGDEIVIVEIAEEGVFFEPMLQIHPECKKEFKKKYVKQKVRS